MNIEGLKEQARRHEQKEEWKKALDLYLKAIERLEEEDKPDVGLYNRVGDLCVRVGDIDKATRQYEQAVELYVDAELPNNAIAVCKKIIRNVPARHTVHLSMGRIRAKQGFLTDARQSFLTYAERVQAAGDMDEALRALEELADLFPGDVEGHMALARHLQQRGRSEEALTQLRSAYRSFVELGDAAGASAVEAKAKEIDASADFSTAPSRAATGGTAAAELEDMPFELGATVPETAESEGDAAGQAFDLTPAVYEGFELTSLHPEPEAEPESRHESAAAEEAWPSFSIGAPEQVADGREDEAVESQGGTWDGFSIGQPSPAELADAEEEDASPLPLMEWSSGDTQSASLQLDELESDAEPLPLLAEEPGSSAPLTTDFADTPDTLIAAGDLAGAERLIRQLIAKDPDDVSHVQRLVEVAYRRGDVKAQADAYVELARYLERAGSAAQAEGVYRQALHLDPDNAAARTALAASDRMAAESVSQVASTQDYVDLGSLILGDDGGEKSTRFKVAYEEPTGDEQADFARMLNQFKAKIAETVAADDVRAHHDLGVAYKEMGLIDEAIEEFQAALRASRDHLPTYELLGQCFLAKGQPEAAVTSLERALLLSIDVEDELVGIYYYLGRAYQQTGNTKSAVEYFNRVFSLDINFMDVTERLRALR
jgi:tetratricopeptide (TPR) repeat protein